MTLSTSLLLAVAMVSFRGYVPPHAASDGLRYQIAADAGSDVPGTMKACGVDDFAAVRSSGSNTYQFAVTRAAEASAQCVRTRLPAGSRFAPLDHWTTDAQAD